MNPVFIQKDDQNLPDFYEIEVEYHNGQKVSFEVSNHRILKEIEMVEFCTKDDKWHLIPINSFRLFSFDSKFSKIMAIREKKMREANASQVKTEVKNEEAIQH